VVAYGRWTSYTKEKQFRKWFCPVKFVSVAKVFE
jgi:hydrogenase/urease accessory protein HupE